MVEPVLVTIATVVAKQAAGLLSAGVGSAVASLAKIVRDRFGSDPEAQAALTGAAATPEDEQQVQRLAVTIGRIADTDPVFDQRVRDLWTAARNEGTASENGVVNQISGQVSGNVVQARDIHGGITF